MGLYNLTEYVVGRYESSIVLEIHVAGHLGRFADEFSVDSLLGGSRFGIQLCLELIFFQPGIALAYYSFHLEKVQYDMYFVPLVEGKLTAPNFLVFLATPMTSTQCFWLTSCR